MNRRKRLAVVACAVAAGLGAEASRGAVVFSDNFATSSLNPTSYPSVTATSTGYEIASTKNTSNSTIGSTGLNLTLNAATTSGVIEAQALFTNAPLTLTNAGDFVEVTFTFTNTNVLAAGTSSFVYVGLYNSGAVAPVSGLNQSGLSTATPSTFAIGGTSLWQGYAARIADTGGSSQTYTRPQQGGAGTTSANQDLVGNNAGGGLYNNPAGSSVGSSVTSAVNLVNGNVYTDDFAITLNANGSVTITSNLYDGNSTAATNLATQSVTTGTTPLATTYDGLAFGFRTSGTSLAPVMNVTSLTVSSNLLGAPVPEPATAGMLAMGAVGALVRRRRRA